MISPTGDTGPFVVVRDEDDNTTGWLQDREGVVFDPSDLDADGRAKRVSATRLRKALGEAPEEPQAAPSTEG